MSNTPQTPQKAIAVTTKYIKELGSPLKVVGDPAVGQQLVSKFSQMYELPISEAKRFYEREKDNFTKLISQSDDLRSCTPMSIYLAFGKVMSLKLSFDNGKSPLVYLIPGNRNVGTKDNPQWIKEVVAQPSPYGEKEVRINSGILRKVGHPQIVYKGDIYTEKTVDGEMVVYHEKLGKSDEIVGSWIKITEPDGTVVYKSFKKSDWETWARASDKKNRGKGANALYSSNNGQIDRGFLEGKTLSHSFKGYKQVDFAFKSPEGFVPDTKAAGNLNEGFMDDMIDTDYDEVPAGQIGDGAVQYDAPAKDSFEQEFDNATKDQEPTLGVKVDVKSSEDEPGW